MFALLAMLECQSAYVNVECGRGDVHKQTYVNVECVMRVCCYGVVVMLMLMLCLFVYGLFACLLDCL